MTWIIRASGRAYHYRSVRRGPGNRVLSIYVGCLPAEVAGILKTQAAEAASERSAARLAARVAWKAERRRWEAVERRVIEADAAYGGLAEVALVAAGYHRPKRDRWRRRRRRAMVIPAGVAANQAGARPAVATAIEIGAMLDRLDRAEGDGDHEAARRDAQAAIDALVKAARGGDERARPGLRALLSRRPDLFSVLPFFAAAVDEAAKLAAPDGDLIQREGIARQIIAIRDELAGPAPGLTLLERLLAERIALAWFDAHRTAIAAGRAELAGEAPARQEFWSRQASRLTARVLASIRALATVRRLAIPVLAMPVLHLHAAGAGSEGGGGPRALAQDPS